MSDKFLVDIPTTSTSTYTQKRSAQHLKSLRAGQAKNLPSTKELEEQRRREGLNTSLFAQHASASRSVGSGLRRTQQDDEEDEEDDDPPKAGPSGRGPAAAMGMMMKMGWKMGEGLGRQRSPSPDTSSKRARQDGTDEGKSGVGKSNGQSRGRAEPIRISLWAGRKGLTARSPSPPPLPSKNNPDVLDGRKMERLGRETDDFRERQRRDYKDKEVERKEFKARELLAGFDQEKGVKVSFDVPLRSGRKLIFWPVPSTACPPFRPSGDSPSSVAQTHIPRTSLLPFARPIALPVTSRLL